MTDTSPTSLLQRLLVGYLVSAKTTLDDTTYQKVYSLLPGYLAVANEMVNIGELANPALMRHAIACLADGNSVEETLMFTFMLDIYRLTSSGSGHPLETGIIRQRIIGLLPVFAKARDNGFIRQDLYSTNEALMLSIADKSEDMADALSILAAGYTRYASVPAEADADADA